MGSYSPSELDSIRADAYADAADFDEYEAEAMQGQPAPASRKVWTADDIKALLAQSDKAVGRALVALLARQTAAEQRNHVTTDANGRGFNAFDAEIFTSMANFYQKRWFLTDKQLAFLRSGTAKRPAPRINKYAAQLADIANGGH